jgi:hypothetical protein
MGEVRRRSRAPRDPHRSLDPLSIVALKALRVLGDVRTRHVALTTRAGYEYRLRTRLATAAIADAIAELTVNALAWVEAGEQHEPAAREVIADSYRRHRAGLRELAFG